MWGGWLGKVTRWLHCSQPPRVVLGACSHRMFWKFWCPEIISGSCTYTVTNKRVISIWIQVISVAVVNDFTIPIADTMTYLDIEDAS